MPKDGFSSITLSDDVIAQLQDRVKKSKRTIPKEIEIGRASCRERV